ncbi:MAG: glutathione peroxidase [Phycisphaerales bacterium]
MHRFTTLAAAVVVAMGASAGAAIAPAPQPDSTRAAPSDPAYALGFKLKRLDGTEEDLSAYKGKVVVIVNVASKCGFTPQYQGLEKLYEAKKDRGLVVLGFPSNSFNQEPMDNAKIAESCSADGVTFPMFEKVSVKGEDAAPLYKKLAAQPAPIGGEPKWNFTKFVLDREGKVVARFDADRKHVRTPDLEPAMLKKVDELLGAPGDGGDKGGGSGAAGG